MKRRRREPCTARVAVRADMPALTKKIRALPNFLECAVERAGWRPTLGWLACRTVCEFGWKQPARWKIRPPQTKHPLLIRLGRSSDLDCFRQIFLEDEYACLRDIPSPQLIMDLGAYVGYSSAYFLSCFPSAKVVALEPAPDNYEVCSENLEPYGDRVRLVQGAVWPRRCTLRLSRGTFGDGREWATQVREFQNDHGTIADGWDIPSLLSPVGSTWIDLLKVDVERSELEVFGNGAEVWLPHVRNICIELHGSDCEQVFFRALQSFEFELQRSGELTICRNLRRRRDST